MRLRPPYSRSHRRRGLAIVAAVVLIGLTGVAFIALASLVRHDVRRTTQARTEAQLRQLLLAGEAAAVATLDSPQGHAAQNITLPAELSNDGAALSIKSSDGAGDSRSLDVQALCAGVSASQRLTYQRRDGRWVLVGAEVLPTSGAAADGR